jgi:hypothetical protein
LKYNNKNLISLCQFPQIYLMQLQLYDSYFFHNTYGKCFWSEKPLVPTSPERKIYSFDQVLTIFKYYRYLVFLFLLKVTAANCKTWFETWFSFHKNMNIPQKIKKHQKQRTKNISFASVGIKHKIHSSYYLNFSQVSLVWH